ncbi:MAG: tRNA (adenosine(37)-N6)-threonylcarbamoyltransferase complex ATPase subunit type 1 TsaE [Candidatus Ryanbacteria bacterium CG10_big_fil_rev_8_21_14_0_10_43_42]|uniref:tRNA threonylcarbamoyladenosine biosynthesis protein TsaE n=1 Tax=Candidatus Ryanbacteria bacterium CG10_big_fil_rev_8_21_14_0_10_43_42 TaxID=1974864 RepID=A0A2M8KWD8_9BACT|nr:MAG: tRNA (adenosine(37)-N6)-threonylcarbamoyltransferase complex ATPase subunit type 1 TsaE [Candidatus Ryanbacteria bacterium CG10_big_fil_rev_8_21_14_0_10_43_42]
MGGMDATIITIVAIVIKVLSKPDENGFDKKPLSRKNRTDHSGMKILDKTCSFILSDIKTGVAFFFTRFIYGVYLLLCVHMESKEFTSHSEDETKAIARSIAKELMNNPLEGAGALVVALTGNLGGGKTTFTQGFAEGFGITETVLSPTFILMNTYPIPLYTTTKTQHESFKNLVHIDAYRLDTSMQLHALGWEDIMKSIHNIVLIEWADRARKLLPERYVEIQFEVIHEKTRRILLKIL